MRNLGPQPARSPKPQWKGARMCGIVGYVGPRPAQEIILDGLRRLEYRGYDSAGAAVVHAGRLGVRKTEGKMDRLTAVLEESPLPGSLGVGHTRWATHGPPSDVNAHPHTDEEGSLAVVHNGIIENFQTLREELAAGGVTLRSETDTEVLAHLIAAEYDGDLAAALRRAMARTVGTYAVAVISDREPDRLVAARLTSPLVVGLGEGEMFLASDMAALLNRTRRFLVVEDGEIVDVTAEGAVLETIDGAPVSREPLIADWKAGEAERGGYDHFMLKEIHEQPEVIAATLAGRISDDGGRVVLDNLEDWDIFAAGDEAGDPRDLQKVWITGCGTAYHAGLAGVTLMERLAGLPAEAAYAHELRYRRPPHCGPALTLAISQSGETADTLAAARMAAEQGSRLLALTNVVGSTLTRAAHRVIYTRGGPEIAVASTKAYLAMLVGGSLLALWMARRRGTVEPEREAALLRGLRDLPGQVSEILDRYGGESEISLLAADLARSSDLYFIGRGADYATAMEGALKLKEVSYLHAEAMPAGELKHGALALVEEGTPVVGILTQDDVYDKSMSSLWETKARGARVIAVAYEDDEEAGRCADRVLRIPRTDDLLAPVLAAPPLQLLAYHTALALGCDIDQPRNLAKSVTVE